MEDKNNILNKIGKRNPFTVPDNYFEDFAAQMSQKIQNEKVIEEVTDAPVAEPVEKKPIVVSFYAAHIQPLLHVAVVMAILVGLSYFIAQPFLQPYKDSKVELAQLAISESEYYDLLEDYDTDELYDILSYNN